MNRKRSRPDRSDVFLEIDRRFPRSLRADALEAVDIFVHQEDSVRARMQLTILSRSDGDVRKARELALHMLAESAGVHPPRDPETVRNERYAG